MNFLKKLFGESNSSNTNPEKTKSWDIRSLEDLVELLPLKSGVIPFKKAKLSQLVTIKDIIGVVSEEKTIFILDSKGNVLSSCSNHDKPICAFAIDPEGDWFAFAEKESGLVYFKSIRDPKVNFQIEAVAPVSVLTLGKNAVYVGLESGEIEVYPLSFEPTKRLLSKQYHYKFASQIFKEPHAVAEIELSPNTNRIAAIIGGGLFVTDDDLTGNATAYLKESRYIATRFSNNGQYLAAGGGTFEAQILFGEDEDLRITEAHGFLDILDLENDRKIQFRGEGYWIANIFWSANNDRLLCLFCAAPQGIDSWTEAISFHNTNSIWSGTLQPESVTKIPTSINIASAGIISPDGRLLMVKDEEKGKIGYWIVGKDFIPSETVSSKTEESTPQSTNTNSDIKKTEYSLDAIVIVFNRDFPTSGQFAEEILNNLTTRGRTYKSWMRDNTPVRIKVHQKAQDQMTVASIAFVEFRKLIGDKADPGNIQFGTFEGSQGIFGSVLSHWH